MSAFSQPIFTIAQAQQWADAVSWMTTANAHELPFHESVIAQAGRVVESLGYMTAGKWAVECRDRPISTLMNFIAWGLKPLPVIL